ncbi:hypothetical protein [Aurantiacibacter sp. D1-12]|uniref:hypothetical protein n=1 Tax=Aurantiacibacter sp. D1-12 TaxID=2993658 RepID=UPI00237C9D90|nr:hypothetical protein [Aurantiacibacter sp. D1-12]MDE1466895.1 hypothetical protein [Aurantiacibacter sp. D1-12]
MLRRIRNALSMRRQSGRLRSLEQSGLRRFVPPVDATTSVLIIGAGPSASREALEDLLPRYDYTIAINSARNVAQTADVFSFEFAYRHADVRETQFAALESVDHARAVIKPFSLAALTADELRQVVKVWRDGGVDSPAFLDHRQISPIFASKHPEILVRRNRPAMQWRGSVTVWLDTCWLAGVRKIGLIGTDMGQMNENGEFEHHLTNQDRDDGPGVLRLLDTLCRTGYLEGVEFDHHHPNPVLRDILKPR